MAKAETAPISRLLTRFIVVLPIAPSFKPPQLYRLRMSLQLGPSCKASTNAID